METTHEAHHHDEHSHGDHGYSHHEHAHDDAHTHEPEHGHGGRGDEDWNDEEFVTGWIARQSERAAERHRQFVTIRALIPKTPGQEFRYLNLGAGHGALDELLLDAFKGANAVLVDTSLIMLAEARNRLARFGDRVEYVQANLANESWKGAVSGPFDVVVSSITVHNLRDAGLIRQLYAQVYQLTGHGGILLNLDYVRPASPQLGVLAPWAAKDPEANLSPRHGMGHAGSLDEHLGWLREAGYGSVDVLWKDMGVALMCAVRDHLHMPEEHAPSHSHDEHDHGHAHSH